MVITNDVNLPDIESLNVPEVNLSMATLLSAGPYLGKACENINNEFMLCREEKRDPRACINLGKRVTACTLDFFRMVKQCCLEEFTQYVNCIDKSSGNFSFTKCRNTQEVFDSCMKERVCMDRPHFGYFTRARVHDSPSAAPGTERSPTFPDPTPSLPDSRPRTAPRFGSRFYWMTE